MSKHTKGPWFVDVTKTTLFIANSDVTFASVEIPSDSMPITKAEAVANARLIAAAPNLLRSLQMAVALLEFHGLADTASAIAVMKDTLATAKGGGHE